MAENTKIEWCDCTFEPWRGCSRVSPGILGEWGSGGKRVIAAESYWRRPLKWDRAAAVAGVRPRVFCAPLADVFEDRPELRAPRRRLWELIVKTPHLDWLLLTERPENINRLLGPRGINFYAVEGPVPCPQPNVWLGTSVEDQRRADERIPHLLRAPAAVRFLSVEPLLGPVDLKPWLASYCPGCGAGRPRTRDAVTACCNRDVEGCGLDWVIIGGESGRNVRPCDVAWVRSLVDQCRLAGVACFVRQDSGPRPGVQGRLPDDLWRVKEFPRVED